MRQPSLTNSMSFKLLAFISKLKLPIAIYFLSFFFLSGCSPIYFLRAAYEEGKILWRREPIERLLEKPDLDPETREKLRLVLAVRDYARDALKFRVGGSYASYSYVDGSALTYVVMAVPKTDLTPYAWWFPVVGKFPYKGFFSEAAAKAEAESFQAQGYDTYIRAAPAFSTLGWFDDPLLSHLLEYDQGTLAEIIFHELFHNTLFVAGAVDFNESLATFVGNQAAILFFRDRYGAGSREHQNAVQAWQEALEFSAYINEAARSLKDLYGRGIAEEEKLKLRSEIFSRTQHGWLRRTANHPAHRLRAFGQQEINNAVIAHYLLYFRNLGLFESLYQAEGKNLARSLELIIQSIRDREDHFDAVRDLVGKKSSSARPPSE